MKSKVLVKLIVVLIASAIILLLGTTKLPAGFPSTGIYGGSGLYGGRSTDSDLKIVGGLYDMYCGGTPYWSYGSRSNSSVYEAYGARVKFDKLNPNPLSSPAFGLIPFF